MMLHEAIRTGKLFKRPNDNYYWKANSSGVIVNYVTSTSWTTTLPLSVENILATDWEVEEPKITLNFEEFYNVVLDTQNYGIKNTWESIVKDYSK